MQSKRHMKRFDSRTVTMKNDKIRVGFIGANPPTKLRSGPITDPYWQTTLRRHIVGGGSAGAVLAMPLSADAQHV